MANFEEHNDNFAGVLLGILFIGFLFFIYLIYYTISGFNDSVEKRTIISSKSDSYILLTSGRYEQGYYTNHSTIRITENGSCISFTDNSTNAPVAACTQFTIKANK